MAQLQIPLTIWLAATPAERDGFYLSAGFDPNLPVIDNGTDTMTVRFRQDPPVGLSSTASQIPGHDASHVPQAGDDLRDFQPVSFTPNEFAEFGNGAAPPAVAGTAIAIAGRTLRLILGGGGGRLTAAVWNSLPSLVRTALTQLGIGVGALIAFNGDIPFITLPGQGDNVPALPLGPELPPVDIQIGGGGHAMHGAQIVGSWNTNPKNPADGVTFYRLANGWLAVMNKKGRWKTWKPKRPIVLYSDGASNIKTMLRADKALSKQAKQIASFLNRRGPKSRASPKKDDPKTIIIQGSGKVVDV